LTVWFYGVKGALCPPELQIGGESEGDTESCSFEEEKNRESFI